MIEGMQWIVVFPGDVIQETIVSQLCVYFGSKLESIIIRIRLDFPNKVTCIKC